jgi:glycosyltransferase involved in cell wall biosynthesis
MKLFRLVIKALKLIPQKGVYFTAIKTWLFVKNQVTLCWLNFSLLDSRYTDSSKYTGITNARKAVKVRVSVSVIIPNYNYARYLPQRITGIINQSVAPLEIIFLDDYSSDDSLAIADKLLKTSGIDYQIVANTSNQGVYAQWCKGIKLARGDYIWIAEADDFCSNKMLGILFNCITNNNADLAYCQSMIIDDNNKITHANLHALTDEFSLTLWNKNFCLPGQELVQKYWFHKNLIINASSCIFSKKSVENVNLDQLAGFKYCGDWFFYVSLLRLGKLCYTNRVLNVYRKHQHGVTQRNFNSTSYFAEIMQIKEFMLANYSIPPSALTVDKKYLHCYSGFDEHKLDALYHKYTQIK